MKLLSSFTAKTAAVFLFVITAALTAAGILAVAVSYQNGIYTQPSETVLRMKYYTLTQEKAQSFLDDYYSAVYNNNPYGEEQWSSVFSRANCNMSFALYDGSNKLLLTNYALADGEYGFEKTLSLNSFSYNGGEYTRYTVVCRLASDLTADDEFGNARVTVEYAVRYKWLLPALTCLCAAAAILIFIFLMCSAGHRRGHDGITPGAPDRIPLDLAAALTAVLAALLADAYGWIYDDTARVIYVIAAGVAVLLAALGFCMTFAVRIKCGGWWKSTVLCRLGRWLAKAGESFVRTLPMTWKALIALAAVTLIELLLMLTFSSVSALTVIWMWEKLLLIPVVCVISYNFTRLREGGQAIARGDLTHRVDTSGLIGEFKQHGENLNSINEAVTKAVDERMKSEKFKTELITNVSHDIKTPLTSIISYIDLIKKLPSGDPKLADYISVLDRQSARLKKLVEDLVEASKASSGAINVEYALTEPGVMLVQTAGEYEERLAENGLELILGGVDCGALIMADGRLLWRVFDNLMTNICKYSLPSTRVYLDIVRDGGRVSINFKNISKYRLNITSDELMERFVRGDSSRHTDGSGLGLSIARSLTELMGGALELTVTGDLFMTSLSFPEYIPGEEKAAEAAESKE